MRNLEEGRNIFLFQVRFNGLASMSINQHIPLDVDEIINKLTKTSRNLDILL